uniref:Uncharacterized protein n=1 Tax=Panagrolaimus sp. PS1159 TaxID=55785 RepID=A0AC35F8Z5_9BILA
MSEKSLQITQSFKPPKSPLECLNIHLPSIDKSDSQKDDISDDDEVTNVYMHIYSAEGREYTSYTTFHGMIRIFNSSTWPSVLFWCLLVLTCVVFYIYYSGSILGRYFKKHTYQETNYLTFNTFEFSYPMIFICPSLPYSLKALKDNNLTDKSIDYLNTLSWRQSEFDFEKFKIIDNKNWTFDELRTFQKLSSKTCYEVVSRSSYGKREINVCADSRQVETINGYCLLLNLSKSIINTKTDKAVRLILKNHDSNLADIVFIRKISLYATLRNSTFLTPPHGGNCISNWTDTNLGKYFNINPQLPYSRKVCEHLKFSKAVAQKHDCIPSHMKQIIKSKFPICNVFNAFQLNFSSEVSDDKCFLECQRKRFIYSKFGNHPIKIWNGIEGINKNISLLEMSFSSRIYQKRSQVKMLQTVDILSRIGGNTSLFFGFSCVTLMETFIFLLKSLVQLFSYQPPPPEDIPKLPTIIYNKIKQPQSRDSIAGAKEDDGRREGFFSAETLSQKRENRKVSLRPAEDTISEKDEGESPRSSISKKKPLHTNSEELATNKRRQFAALERFRSSIYTMTQEQSQRVKEPCYGFRASIDNTSLSGPLHTNRASIISFGQHRTSNPRVRIVIEDSQKRRPSILTRYNSAIGNF